MTFGLISLLLAGCHYPDEKAPPSLRVTLSGAVAKGPFVRGSSVSAFPVDAAGTPTGESFSTETTDDAGRFELAMDVEGTVRLEAEGYYYNEVTGQLSAAPITLRSYHSFAEAGAAVAFINTFTHLTSERVEAMLDSGASFDDAVQAAEAEAVAELHVGPASFSPGASGGAMDLLGGDNDANAWIFALSTVLVRHAMNEAGDGGAVDATLAVTINGIASDLADGALDGGPSIPTGDELYALQATIDADAVMALLAQRFADIGSDAVVPDLHRVFDLDLDGTVDIDDTDADGDGHLRAEAGGDDCADYDPAVHPGATEDFEDGVDVDCTSDTDGDGHLSPEAGGDDCDDADADTAPGAPEVWYDGVDQACDGGNDFDQDGDGHDEASLGGDDCDDLDPDVHPGAPESWYDGIDTDCDSARDFPLASANVEYTGESATNFTGSSVAGAGDMNGDGYDDLLVGSYNQEGGEVSGAAYIVLGSASPASASLSTAAAKLVGQARDMAYFVAGVGDVNADGYGDVMVGAPLNGDGGHEASGAAYLILGSSAPASRSLAFADAELSGEGISDNAGSSVAGAGDVDGDGYADMLVGSYRGVSYAGTAYLVRGSSSPASMSLASADAVFTAENAYDVATRGAGAGDVDADGLSDVLIGAPLNDEGGSDAGAVYLLLGSSGPTSRSLALADAKLAGEAAADLAGWDVAGAGDVDADGYADILVGAQGNADHAGAVYLVRGGSVLRSMSLSAADAEYGGEVPGDCAGYSVASAGDVNADGHADILIGSSRAAYGGGDFVTGSAALVLGSSAPASRSLESADATFAGEAVGDFAGASVGSAGDADGNGFDDIVIGALCNSDGGACAGAAYLLLGGI